MNLEDVIKYHSAKSNFISDIPNGTNSETLKNTDFIAALGFAQSEAFFGLSAFFGKTDVSKDDKIKAIRMLNLYALSKCRTCKFLNKIKGREKNLSIQLICIFAYNEYCVTAETPDARCIYCKGRGLVVDFRLSKIKNSRITKPCKRCKGVGFHKPPSSNLFRALKIITPSLTQSTFLRQVKPFMRELITKCYIEESKANAVLNAVIS